MAKANLTPLPLHPDPWAEYVEGDPWEGCGDIIAESQEEWCEDFLWLVRTRETGRGPCLTLRHEWANLGLAKGTDVALTPEDKQHSSVESASTTVTSPLSFVRSCTQSRPSTRPSNASMLSNSSSLGSLIAPQRPGNVFSSTAVGSTGAPPRVASRQRQPLWSDPQDLTLSALAGSVSAVTTSCDVDINVAAGHGGRIGRGLPKNCLSPKYCDIHAGGSPQRSNANSSKAGISPICTRARFSQTPFGMNSHVASSPVLARVPFVDRYSSQCTEHSVQYHPEPSALVHNKQLSTGLTKWTVARACLP